MSNNLLGEIIETLKELRRMHQLNFELLDQLNVACGWVLENHIDLPNKEKLASLLSKGTTLLEEINTESASDEWKHVRKSDDKVPEPFFGLFFRMKDVRVFPLGFQALGHSGHRSNQQPSRFCSQWVGKHPVSDQRVMQEPI